MSAAARSAASQALAALSASPVPPARAAHRIGAKRTLGQREQDRLSLDESGGRGHDHGAKASSGTVPAAAATPPPSDEERRAWMDARTLARVLLTTASDPDGVADGDGEGEDGCCGESARDAIGDMDTVAALRKLHEAPEALLLLRVPRDAGTGGAGDVKYARLVSCALDLLVSGRRGGTDRASDGGGGAGAAAAGTRGVCAGDDEGKSGEEAGEAKEGEGERRGDARLESGLLRAEVLAALQRVADAQQISRGSRSTAAAAAAAAGSATDPAAGGAGVVERERGAGGAGDAAPEERQARKIVVSSRRVPARVAHVTPARGAGGAGNGSPPRAPPRELRDCERASAGASVPGSGKQRAAAWRAVRDVYDRYFPRGHADRSRHLLEFPHMDGGRPLVRVVAVDVNCYVGHGEFISRPVYVPPDVCPPTSTSTRFAEEACTQRHVVWGEALPPHGHEMLLAHAAEVTADDELRPSHAMRAAAVRAPPSVCAGAVPRERYEYLSVMFQDETTL